MTGTRSAGGEKLRSCSSCHPGISVSKQSAGPSGNMGHRSLHPTFPRRDENRCKLDFRSRSTALVSWTMLLNSGEWVSLRRRCNSFFGAYTDERLPRMYLPVLSPPARSRRTEQYSSDHLAEVPGRILDRQLMQATGGRARVLCFS